ncbi:unnamed protein product [Dicrocoelium dendriticum]|nr:unnamed protein product [Dicrocoelium dendriticum]
MKKRDLQTPMAGEMVLSTVRDAQLMIPKAAVGAHDPVNHLSTLCLAVCLQARSALVIVVIGWEFCMATTLPWRLIHPGGFRVQISKPKCLPFLLLTD